MHFVVVQLRTSIHCISRIQNYFWFVLQFVINSRISNEKLNYGREVMFVDTSGIYDSSERYLEQIVLLEVSCFHKKFQRVSKNIKFHLIYLALSATENPTFFLPEDDTFPLSRHNSIRFPQLLAHLHICSTVVVAGIIPYPPTRIMCAVRSTCYNFLPRSRYICIHMSVYYTDRDRAVHGYW